jgi:hypothetical protein
MHVCIFARGAIESNLLASLVDAAGRTPVVADDGEPPDEAIARGTCGAAVVDCDHPQLDAIIDAAVRRGVRPVLFSTARDPADVAEWGARLNVPALSFPASADRVRSLLDRLTEEWALSRARGFSDSTGHRWYVRELPPLGSPGREAATLMFFRSSSGGTSGDHLARRVWRYPSDWRELSDAELEAICNGPPGRPGRPGAV